MKPLILLLIACTTVSVSENIRAQSAAELATQVCAACHGPNGNSISSLFPRLAAQTATYLDAQLKAFRGRVRADPSAQAFMWGMSSQLDDETIHQLGLYYAGQTLPHYPGADHALIARGRSVYEQESPNGKVPSCQACHGAQAQGSEAVPRLAGQHASYLVRQLQFFKAGLRANDRVMLEVCGSMTDEQIEAVAAYAASR
jgi:cytochrome c553